MDFGGLAFFGFLGAIIIVPQVLRYRERGRLHETLRAAFERGQPVPPELIAALQWGRRGKYVDYDIPPEVMAAWQPRGPAPAPGAAPSEATAGAAPPPHIYPQGPLMAPVFINPTRPAQRPRV